MSFHFLQQFNSRQIIQNILAQSQMPTEIFNLHTLKCVVSQKPSAFINRLSLISTCFLKEKNCFFSDVELMLEVIQYN